MSFKHMQWLSGDILIMLISSVLTGTLAAKLKIMPGYLSNRHFVHRSYLIRTDYFNRRKNSEEILCVTCKQLVRLLNRDIVAYIVKNNDFIRRKDVF